MLNPNYANRPQHHKKGDPKTPGSGRKKGVPTRGHPKGGVGKKARAERAAAAEAERAATGAKKPGPPKGVRYGGRQKGTPPKIQNVKVRRAIEAALLDAHNEAKLKDKAAAKLTPLDFMLEVLRHPSEFPFSARQWGAKEAAPYIHKKMPIAIEGGDRPLQFIDSARLAAMSTQELETLIAALEKIGVITGPPRDDG